MQRRTKSVGIRLRWRTCRRRYISRRSGGIRWKRLLATYARKNNPISRLDVDPFRHSPTDHVRDRGPRLD